MRYIFRMRRALPIFLLIALLLAGAVVLYSCRPAHVATRPHPALPPMGPANCGGHCGTERWAIKTLSDPDRELVDLTPVTTTISALRALDRPARMSETRRFAPVETTVWRVQARLMWLKREDDEDYHLVIAEPNDTTVTMIAEIPDPACGGSCASGFSSIYGTARQVLFDRVNRAGGQRAPLVWITGVGFFDYPHRQRGLAPNAIELHPVLKVEWPATSLLVPKSSTPHRRRRSRGAA